MKITLASAFRYRSKIKDLTVKIGNAVTSSGTKIAIENVEEMDRYKNMFLTKDYDKDIQLALELMDLQTIVNKAIAEANQGINDVMQTIYTCNAKIALLNDIIDKINKTQLVVTDYDKDGRKIKTICTKLYEKNWVEEMANACRLRNECEDKLNEYNALTKVEFDVPEHLKKLLEIA